MAQEVLAPATQAEAEMAATARGLLVAVLDTTQQAVSFLNVSRPFVVKEIEAGRIKCHME